MKDSEFYTSKRVLGGSLAGKGDIHKYVLDPERIRQDSATTYNQVGGQPQRLSQYKKDSLAEHSAKIPETLNSEKIDDQSRLIIE